MEQSLSETGPASSPPKKKRGRPKKAEKSLVPQSDASAAVATKLDAPKVRRKKRKAIMKSASVAANVKKKRTQGMSPSSKISDSDGAGGANVAPEKAESADLDVNVGQQVHGVVDGMFDAGYLVTVRVGETETVYRGVVFGPGLSLPLSRENDVAPKTKRMNREVDDTPDVAPVSSGSLDEGGAVAATSGLPALPKAAVNSASIAMSPMMPHAGEAHRAVAMAGMEFPMRTLTPTPILPPPPFGAVAYSPSGPYRPPGFVQSPALQNASGGFYHAPTQAHAPNPNNSNHGSAPYYPPRGFPGYAFQYNPMRAEYAGASPHFAAAPAAAAASLSPSPNMQGTLPPRAS